MKTVENKKPLVYSSDYNIGLLGIEKFHPFDTAKYRKVYKKIRQHTGISKKAFHKPDAIDDEGMKLVHFQPYLDSLYDSRTIASVAEMPPLGMIPAGLLRKNLLGPMRKATGGTILGAQLAIKHGWAVNLSGGYHHAKRSNGEGFCYFADIPLAILHTWKKNPEYKVLVIDLDAHQGNGVEMVLQDDPHFFMLDMYNSHIYPHDSAAKKFIDYHYPLDIGITDKPYLDILEKALEKAVADCTPDLIIYNAGTDIYEKDPLGQMRISEAGILIRDQMVFDTAFSKNIPILMVLSGGYSPESGHIIGRSICNLIDIIKGLGMWD